MTPIGLVSFYQPEKVAVLGKRRYILKEPYYYYWSIPYVDENKNSYMLWNRIIILPEFAYDGASVPRIFWSLTGLTPDGIIRAAALVHDAMYVYDGRTNKKDSHILHSHWNPEQEKWIDVQTSWSKKEADLLFKKMFKQGNELAKQTNQPYHWNVWINLAYFAVDKFGKY